MRYVYFTKLLQKLDLNGLIAFAKETGLDGFDLAVRPGFPVTPDNVKTELPRAAKVFKDAGLIIGLVTGPTNLNDPSSRVAQELFDACGAAGVPAIKLGYFSYDTKHSFDAQLAEARRRLSGFARLAEKTKVRACYHTHSGAYLGNNAAGLRLLLQDMDPHHVGAFLDTGHTAINGGPIRMELELARPWLTLIAIKDMTWEKRSDGWRSHVVPAGEGMVRWPDVAAGLKACKFNGTISLHGEYETTDLETRKKLALQELALLKKHLV